MNKKDNIVMNQKSELKAQILVILLIALAILSIFVVVVATNARRDTIESIQNKQYEQALSIAEDKLLKFVNDELSSEECEQPDAVGDRICNVNPDDSSQEVMQVKLFKPTNEDAGNIPIDKDRTLKISLDDASEKGYKGDIQVYWDGDADVLFSIDYIVGDSYQTIKDVKKGEGKVINSPSNCVSFESSFGGTYDNPIPASRFAKINIGEIISNCAPSPVNVNDVKVLALRLKPLVAGSANISTSFWVKGSGLPKQVKVYIAEAYSTVEGQTDTPKAIIELKEPLNNSPIEILDYVLRTQDTITK